MNDGLTIARVVAAAVVTALVIAEVAWRIWDWPERDPGWAGLGRLAVMMMLVVVALTV